MYGTRTLIITGRMHWEQIYGVWVCNIYIYICILYIYIHTRKYVYIYLYIYIFTYGYSSWQSCLYRRAGMCLNMLCFLIQNRWDGARNTDTKSKQAIHGSWPNKFSFHRLSSICHSDDSSFSILGISWWAIPQFFWRPTEDELTLRTRQHGNTNCCDVSWAEVPAFWSCEEPSKTSRCEPGWAPFCGLDLFWKLKLMWTLWN
jgi:hypothetical protein